MSCRHLDNRNNVFACKCNVFYLLYSACIQAGLHIYNICHPTVRDRLAASAHPCDAPQQRTEEGIDYHRADSTVCATTVFLYLQCSCSCF